MELKVGVEVGEDEYVDTERKIYFKKRKSNGVMAASFSTYLFCIIFVFQIAAVF